MTDPKDRDLGMHRPIPRRDFLQGAAVATTAFASSRLPFGDFFQAEQQLSPLYYPPTLLGLRGSHAGSFEAAHFLRDGAFWKGNPSLTDSGEAYDLIVVGGGISGLSAAWFYRAKKPNARILILENHDDFGGHAKRNEFHVNGRMHLLNGGTMDIDSPKPYSAIASGLLTALGVRPKELAQTCDDPAIYESRHLRDAVFLDKETFGADRLLVGMTEEFPAKDAEVRKLLANAPLSDAVKASIVALECGKKDYLPGRTSDEKKDHLSRISYRDYLLTIVKVDPGVIPYYQHRTDAEWGCGIDAISALDCWAIDLPGFQGLDLKPGGTNRMGYTPRGYATPPYGSDKFHFPDGNASIARLLVRALIPAAIPGNDARDIVTARADYSQLDRNNASVRLRLNQLVVRVRNNAGGVEVAYTRANGAGKIFTARAKDCVLACWNMIIPYLMPELPEPQKTAMHGLIKTPLVYANVALKSWQAFQKLGLHDVHAPGSYFSGIYINQPVNIGNYRSVRSPSDPILIRMERTPAKPGLPEREQHKVGRADILATSFETFERKIREQLGRILGPGGFDSARDIQGIMVNRWPHGYAPEYNSLWDPADADHTPNLVARARSGRVTIANADSGMGAFTDVAIDQAHRAVEELLSIS